MSSGSFGETTQSAQLGSVAARNPLAKYVKNLETGKQIPENIVKLGPDGQLKPEIHTAYAFFLCHMPQR